MAGVSNKGGLLGLTMEVDGVPQIARVLGVAMDRVKNLQPVWSDLADDFVEREQMLFQREGAVPGWSKWAPLSMDYINYKRRKGWSTRILVARGTLRDSLTNRHHKDFYFRAGPRRFEIGTRVPYARYHQRGVPKNNLPKREPIRVTEAQRRHWVKLIQKFLLESGQMESMSIGGR